MAYKKVTHVIFDLDGLLIESESVYEQILNEIASEYGKEYTRQLRMKVLGTVESETARLMITELQLPLTPEDFLVKYEAKVRSKLQNPQLMPGAKALVEHLHKNGVPIAVATSSRENLMEMKMQFHRDLYGLFSHFVCGSSDPEVKNGKPAPDIYQVCASRFPDKPDPSKKHHNNFNRTEEGLQLNKAWLPALKNSALAPYPHNNGMNDLIMSPNTMDQSQCLAFEDAANGVTSAVSAGMQVVMVPDPDTPEERRQSATLVLDSLTKFKPELFGLPAMS